MEFQLGWLQDLLVPDPHGHLPLCLWEEKRLFPVSGMLFILVDPKLPDRCGKRQEKVHKRGNWGGGIIHALLVVGPSRPEGSLFQDWEQPGLGL